MNNKFILIGSVKLVMLGSMVINADGEDLEVLIPADLEDEVKYISSKDLIGVTGKITTHGLVVNKILGVWGMTL